MNACCAVEDLATRTIVCWKSRKDEREAKVERRSLVGTKKKSRQLAQLNRMKRGHLSFLLLCTIVELTTLNHFLNRAKNLRTIGMNIEHVRLFVCA